jgi:2-hydroxychromene-2-carboxylate isomerase
MTPPAVDFFYGIGSRYSYLASTQLDRLAAETGCRMRWRPLYSGDLFAARGRDPFADRPVSGQYEWAYRRRDAERWAAYYGVPYREPHDVRFDPRRLALACTAAAALGAVEAFSRRLFRALFVDGTSPLDAAACTALAREVGLDERGFHTALNDPETAARLAGTVADAIAAGAFGVPSFVVGDEVYFGNDRLPLLRHALLLLSGNERR